MDAAAAKQLYEQYGFLIFRTCKRLLHSEEDAQDALQAVFLKLLEEYHSIRNPQRMVPWIFKTAKHHCFNMLRFNKKFSGAPPIDEIPGDDRRAEAFEAREILKIIFKGHSKKVQEAVYYTYIEHFDQREIQKITGQSPATIRRNLSRFKKSLPATQQRMALDYGKP